MERRTVLTTRRLVLTTWMPSDLDDLCTLHSDAEVMRFVGSGRPETRSEVEARLNAYLAEQQSRGWTKWRVTDTDGAMVGRAGFGAFEGSRELGYALAHDHWGRGLATELATALRDWHWGHPAQGYREALVAFAAVGNESSARVLEKAGFRLVGPRTHEGVPCQFYDCIEAVPY